MNDGPKKKLTLWGLLCIILPVYTPLFITSSIYACNSNSFPYDLLPLWCRQSGFLSPEAIAFYTCTALFFFTIFVPLYVIFRRRAPSKMERRIAKASFMLFVTTISTAVWHSFYTYRRDTRSGLCQSNLRLIEHAKEVLAIKDNLAVTSTPATSDINTYITDGAPSCPEGGIYTYGAVNEDPKCTIGGDHAL